ncbi:MULTISPECIES: hypothetical protein [Bacillaceae]|nr:MULTISPECIES: hypothetical protein [Bacillaceae]UOE95581.1 hypothetical protein MM271_08235 [Alkalihalobacillus sp. LMS39]
MENECFYCNYEIEDKFHMVAFLQADEQVEKPLCPNCYQDWLEGIKG